MSMEIARLVPVVQHVLKFMFQLGPSRTKRDRNAVVCGARDFANPGNFPYGKWVAQDMLIVIVTMTYACIAPIIVIPGIMFFCMGLVCYKHQLLFIYVQVFESGGMFWPKIYRRWIFAMFIAQSTLAGMFILKYAYPQLYCQFALMAITMVFKLKMKSTYTTAHSVAAHLPLELATSLDSEASINPNHHRLDPLGSPYGHPR